MHLVQNLFPLYCVDKKILLSRPVLTRVDIETVVRNSYMNFKVESEVGEGGKKGGNEMVDPHALYAGGAKPAGVGDGGNVKGGIRRGKGKQQQQPQQQQQQRQQQQQQTSRQAEQEEQYKQQLRETVQAVVMETVQAVPVAAVPWQVVQALGAQTQSSKSVRSMRG